MNNSGNRQRLHVRLSIPSSSIINDEIRDSICLTVGIRTMENGQMRFNISWKINFRALIEIRRKSLNLFISGNAGAYSCFRCDFSYRINIKINKPSDILMIFRFTNHHYDLTTTVF